jgi:virulence factor Mce-like protein
MSARTRRSRRTDRPQHGRIFLRGALTTLVLLVLGYIALTSYSGVPGKHYSQLTVDVPRVGSLIPHDLVRIRGVRVGQVHEIAPTRGGRVRLDLQLEPGTPIPADSRVLLRANGLLGARYVEIVPGRSEERLASGAVLRGGEGSLTFGVSDALDTFDAETRGRLGQMIGGLGTGVLGRGDGLNHALLEGSGAIVPARRLFATIAGQSRRLDSIVPSLDTAFGTLDRTKAALGRQLQPAAAALGPFGDQGDDVRDTLREAPSALYTARSGLDAAGGLLNRVRALSNVARPSLSRAPRALRETTRLLREARGPVGRAKTLVNAVPPAVPEALQLTAGLQPLGHPLVESFDHLQTVADRVAPYKCDVVNFAAVFRSMTGFGGIGEGPVGPAMQFRLQAGVTPPEEVLGTRKISGLVKRVGYPKPCRYLASPYPAVPVRARVPDER